jgi:hypothetical protein
MKDKIVNARAMADNLHKTPASEQTIGAIATFTEQAIRDLCDVVESLLPEEDEASADPEPERRGFCEQCNEPLSSESRDCYSGDLVFCSRECRDKYWAKL